MERPPVGIGLAGAALPATEEVLAAADTILRHDLPLLVRESGYAPLGLPELWEAVAGWFEGHGLPNAPGQVLVTTGVQQALALLADLLVRPGDPVLVESPTYPGALDVVRRVGPGWCRCAWTRSRSMWPGSGPAWSMWCRPLPPRPPGRTRPWSPSARPARPSGTALAGALNELLLD